MQGTPPIYPLKVDASGRIALPSDARTRHRIAQGDTVVVVDEGSGLRIKTVDQMLSEVQAHFAAFVPRDVLLSEEVLQDRRAEHERD